MNLFSILVSSIYVLAIWNVKYLKYAIIKKKGLKSLLLSIRVAIWTNKIAVSSN